MCYPVFCQCSFIYMHINFYDNKSLITSIDVNKIAVYLCVCLLINPFKPEFTIVIFIHYKPRIAAAILDL